MVSRSISDPSQLNPASASREAEAFARQRAERILCGMVSQVVKGRRQTVTKRRFTGQKAKPILAGAFAAQLVAGAGLPDLLGLRARAQVAGDAEQPREERHATFIVLGKRRHQLGEHVLGDILGLVVVAHDRADVAERVVAVADVEEPQRSAS